MKQTVLQSVQNDNTLYSQYIDYYSNINPVEGNAIRIKSLVIRGKYIEATKILDSLRIQNEKNNEPEVVFQYHWMAFQLSNFLGIKSDAYNHKLEIIKTYPKVPIRNSFELLVDLHSLDFFKDKDQRQYILNLLDFYHKEKNYYLIGRCYYYLGEIELKSMDYRKASAYFSKSIQYSNINSKDSISKIYPYIGLAEIQLAEDKNVSSFKILQSLKNTVIASPDVLLKEKYYRLYANASALNKAVKDVKWANDNFFNIIDNNNIIRIKARSSLANNIENNYERKLLSEKRIWKYIIVITSLLSLLIIAIIFCAIYFRKKRLKLDSSTKDKHIAEDQKLLIISDKTEKEILQKLDDFEKTNKFIRSNLSVKSLSQSFDTNSRYLSEIINKHKDTNFNTYLNNLRINYIIDKLNTDPNYRKYKISYLAEECGFSTHSLFTTVFKNKVGMSPAEYIKKIES
ncbi:helix-turn-helix domain-containing protein [Chryseobacterium artocarpi]|uniref:helix-turn-helix domain-containing protein n=1 Tax=Chryseobacterium artocarpi TaxID=1414727 RepID=UPI0013F4ECA2|nr:helix-turn-helix domain-containing protein [Chryseobacterium artocarpi]